MRLVDPDVVTRAVRVLEICADVLRDVIVLAPEPWSLGYELASLGFLGSRSSQTCSSRPITTLNGFAPGIQIVAKMRPRLRPVRACPGTDPTDDPPTIDAMPLQIHTQPDSDHFCEACGGPSELISQTISPWDGNEEMAREVSPWTPRCADPWCRCRRPRHQKMRDARACGH